MEITFPENMKAVAKFDNFRDCNRLEKKSRWG